jgi:topoisomerase-4 subunit B
MAKTNYEAKDIEVLKGLEPIRQTPGMYIGSTDSTGLHHLIWEIVDNSVDEGLNGYGDTITVILSKDGKITVKDHGRGVPFEIHPEEKVSTIEVIYGHLFSGGKYNTKLYDTSTGLHGVGGAVVNALSDEFEVTTYRNKEIHRLKFENGGRTVSKLEMVGTTNITGTTVTFKPTKQYFTTVKFEHSIIENWLRTKSFLNSKIRFVFIDENFPETNQNRTTEYYSPNGLLDHMNYNNSGKTPIYEPIAFNGVYEALDENAGTKHNVYTSIVIQNCKEDRNESIISYVNTITTRDGGTHVTGLKSGISKAINDYLDTKKLKNKYSKLSTDDYRSGMTIILSFMSPENLTQFTSQTKEKLGSPVAKTAVEKLVTEKFYFYLIEHPNIATSILDSAELSSKARERTEKSIEDIYSDPKNKQSKTPISTKLTPPQSKNYANTELFLVEGDSAGGSAKRARDFVNQGILPLRGKTKNAEKATAEDLLQNEEISTMIYTIGSGFGAKFNVKASHYSKVILMTDADVDGSHIQNLLLTFFYRYMRPLIENGNVYIANPPLYKIYKESKKKDYLYSWTLDGINDAKKKLGGACLIKRYKGLGEMDPDELWETTMNPETRSLIKVRLDDISAAEHYLQLFMGDKADPRKEWLEKNVEFTLDDDFMIEDKNGK